MDCGNIPCCLAGNFEKWVTNPLKVKPIAHAIWDPHFGESALKAFSKNYTYPVNIAFSGVYQWWYTIGFRTNQKLCRFGFMYIISFIICWLVTFTTKIRKFIMV
jgi:photosystem I P700 chlorophyll a apoprotein A2